ncbi:tetratricopeptide repeat protein [Winogradskya humida]|nr:tetratricopeptide repeat protein [Actinoplanes humidus]
MSMELGRVVVVHAPTGHGSGYAIARRLVLTSAHVVPQVGAQVEVRAATAAARLPATVVWRGTPGGRDDAALLELGAEDPGWDGDAVRWGRTVTNRSGIPAETWGFPIWAQRPGSPPETWHPAGTINAGNRVVADRYVLSLSDHPPRGASPWAGLSGAALFCGRLLTGVIAADLAGGGHAHLDAVPGYVLAHDPEFVAILRRHGSAGPALDGVELDDLAELVRYGRSPAALLIAKRNLVRFRGRRTLMDDLIAWAGPAGFRAWLLHGPGGQGKTRVAHELGRRLRDQRWAVLWLRPGAPVPALEVIGHVAVPLLVIVDYAESQLGQVAEVLRACARHAGTSPVRMLLLARSVGDWWETLQSESPYATEFLEDAPVVRLLELETEAAGRADAYQDALTDLAAALTSQLDIDPALLADTPPYVDAGRPASALTLHMTALADLLDAAYGVDWQREDTAMPVEDRVLHHERRHWYRTADGFGLRTALPEGSLQDTLAATFLLGADNRTEAEDLLESLEVLRDRPESLLETVHRWLAHLYPPPDARPWGALQPDRLAERFAGTRLLKDQRLVDPLLSASSEPQRDRLLTVFARAAHQAAFDGQLDEPLTELCVRQARWLALPAIGAATRVESPGPLVTALRRVADDPQVTRDQLAALVFHVPVSTHTLAGWAVDASQRLVAVDRAAADSEQDTETYLYEISGSLNRLTLRLMEVGRYDEALESAEETITVIRGLADVWPDKYRGDLAAALSVRSLQLGHLGRRMDSVEAVKEAVQIRRGLQDDEALATTLNNLAIRLIEVGRHDEALATITEVVALRRTLAEQNPGGHLPELAMALSNLGFQLGRRDRQAEALVVVREAVAIRRRLCEDEPDAYLPNLAMSLNTLSLQLHHLGHLREALAAGEESATIYRRLRTGRPDAIAPLLAMALNNLARYQSEAGHGEQALATIREAVAIRRVLADQRPAAFRKDLAQSLLVLAVLLETAGHRDQAADNAAEAVPLYRELAAAEPVINLPLHVEILISAAKLHAAAARLPEARTLIGEATAICRQTRDGPALLRTLVLQTMIFGGLGMRQDGLRSADEALRLTRSLNDVPEVAIATLLRMRTELRG